MKTGTEIEREFAERGVKRGGLLLLPASEALAMIAKCREAGLRVLGVDGFSINVDSTQPLMEHSVDLSRDNVLASATGEVDGCQAASDFIAARSGKNLYFEVTIE